VPQYDNIQIKEAYRERKISNKTHRLMTLAELVGRYPDSFFNDEGELIYHRERNAYILPKMLKWLGKYHPGFRKELYIRRVK